MFRKILEQYRRFFEVPEEVSDDAVMFRFWVFVVLVMVLGVVVGYRISEIF
jgi:hypothetical protein